MALHSWTKPRKGLSPIFSSGKGFKTAKARAANEFTPRMEGIGARNQRGAGSKELEFSLLSPAKGNYSRPAAV
jgi:hypothetical protein